MGHLSVDVVRLNADGEKLLEEPGDNAGLEVGDWSSRGHDGSRVLSSTNRS